MMAGGIGIDPDAQAFLSAAGITDATITTAIDTLVIQLKSIGVWTKLNAIYPFVGGTATTHKFNLKDPQDTNAAFRLVFNGGVTHNNNGVTFNGLNSFANTHLVPSAHLQQNNNSTSVYSRTQPANSFGYSGALLPNFLNGYGGNGNVIEVWQNTSTLSNISTSYTSLITAVRRGSGTADAVEVYKAGVSIRTDSYSSQTLVGNNYYLGAVNNISAQFYAAINMAFASLGEGFTDTEAANLYTAVQAFQTTLARQV
jgi:hypothetical protein